MRRTKQFVLAKLIVSFSLLLCFRDWVKEEISTLYWYYVQSKKSRDIIGKIVKLFKSNDSKEKSRLSVIQQLLKQVKGIFSWYRHNYHLLYITI